MLPHYYNNLNEVCFNSFEDCNDYDTTITQLIFKPDLSNAIYDNGFEIGNQLVVRWGFGNTLAEEREDVLTFIPLSNDYRDRKWRGTPRIINDVSGTVAVSI